MLNHAKPTSTLLDSFFKYLFAALLVFIPLYPKFPLFNIPYTYVAIRAEDFLIAIIWVVFIAKLLQDRKFKLPPLSYQFLIFFFVCFVSSLSAILITQNVRPVIVLLHFFRRVEYMSVFFLAYYAAKNLGTRRYYLELILFTAVGVLLYGIAQLYYGAPVISTMDTESSKGIALTLRPGVTLNSTFAGHYDLAVYLTMVLSFIAAISSSISGWLKRVPYLLLFAAFVWLFMKAGSRISLPSLLLSVTAVAYFYRRYLLGFVFVALILGFILTSPSYIDRFKSIFRLIVSKTSQIVSPPVYALATPSAAVVTPAAPVQDISTNIRLNVEWPRAMRSFYKNPLFGTGYSSITLATDNDYLRSLGETGLLGFLAFISILIGLGKKLFSLVSRSSGLDKVIIVSSIGIFISFLSIATFIDVFESSKIAIMFWGFMGLAFSTQKNV